jgi:hypothetical protein
VDSAENKAGNEGELDHRQSEKQGPKARPDRPTKLSRDTANKSVERLIHVLCQMITAATAGGVFSDI